MDTALSRTTRLRLIAVGLAVSAGCGGGDDAQQGAAADTGAMAVGAAGGDVNASGNVAPTEAVAFMSAANMAEVQAAQVAENKATNSEVRQFAQLMQREHSAAARQVGELANRMNVNLEAAGGQGQMVQNLQQMAQQMMQQLNSAPRGQQFDRAYIDGQVQAHQAVLENLQRIAGGTGAPGGPAPTPTQTPGGAGRDTTQGAATPQQAAQMMIPKVQQHLERARQIQSRLGGGR
jgi:putative membrane protein